MKISQLSNKTGASVRSIRYYEKKQLLSSKRLHNGYRVFDESSIERIKTIQLYLGLGLTTEQIENILICMDNNPDYQLNQEFLCEDMIKIYEQKLSEVNEHMDSLFNLKQGLERQISKVKKYNAVRDS
ncbi:MerR family transcriptional regulator [Alkalihalobacillus hemicellulosilyticus]|uniref:Transcriptional regulator n=1 Tax=Halalkalibacter hemicellulosilyticusJCM 9152 TaxID=1236971 RepID=W4QAH8_9BACI|nr:MerR family transcriptional regulator [Halalkalibacter hemicellulosilyticus]GAE28693.1 transcriptional regulator [Halalkalibacter hemicellulosilyticusJCM 9152]